MPRLEWDKTGERLYEAGVEMGALYPQEADGSYPKGVAWNGLTAVNESPSGAESNPFYANNKKYLDIQSAEEYGATVEAYMYPEEFAECDGSKEIAPGVYIGQQDRKAFGLAYKTLIGNDTQGNNHGYKLHIVYGAKAAPSARDHATVNESVEPITLSWELSTTPVAVTGHKPTATITLDSTKIEAEKLKALEDILYGTDEVEARLPLPDEIATLVGTAAAG